MLLNDYELLYYCYQNNEGSFNLLIKKYERYIYYVINLFKKKYYFFSYEDIDLFNEGLILLMECIYSYRDDLDVKFSSYFISCLKKKYLYIIRSLTNNKNKTHALALSLDSCASDDELDLYSIIDNGQMSVAEQVNNSYLVAEGLNTLKSLLNDQEKAIIYYYLKGYSYQEIMTIVKVETKKVDNTIQKYKKLVKKN